MDFSEQSYDALNWILRISSYSDYIVILHVIPSKLLSILYFLCCYVVALYNNNLKTVQKKRDCLDKLAVYYNKLKAVGYRYVKTICTYGDPSRISFPLYFHFFLYTMWFANMLRKIVLIVLLWVVGEWVMWLDWFMEVWVHMC